MIPSPTNQPFDQELSRVHQLMVQPESLKNESSTQIKNLFQNIFHRLGSDLEESKRKLEDDKYKMANKLDDLILYSAHLKGVQELLGCEISEPLSELLNPEDYGIIENLKNHLKHTLKMIIKETEDWEKDPGKALKIRTKKSIDNTFNKLKELVSEQGTPDFIPILEKRHKTILSHYQESHLFRDSLVDKGYDRVPYLFNELLNYGKKNRPLAELFIDTIENLKVCEISLNDIHAFIECLKARPISFKINESDDGIGNSLYEEVIHQSLLYLKSAPFKGSAETIKSKLDDFTACIRNLSDEDAIAICKAASSKGKIYEELLYSKAKNSSEIKQFLRDKTGKDDAYYVLYDQNWNHSEWPKQFAVTYRIYDEQLQPILSHLTKKTFENRIETIRDFSSDLKEVLFRLVQSQDHPTEGLLNQHLQLLGKCENLAQAKNLTNIIRKKPELSEFLNTLPKKLFNNILSHSEELAKIQFVSKLDFFFQTKFIPLLDQLDDGAAYENSLAFYKKDPALLKMGINLEDELGISHLNIKNEELLHYFNEHPSTLKIWVNNHNSFFAKEDHIVSLIRKGDWVEKVCLLFEDDPNFDGVFIRVSGNEINQTFKNLMGQDIILIKKHHKEFKLLAHKLYKLCDPFFPETIKTKIYKTIDLLLAHIHLDDGLLFKAMISQFSSEQFDAIIDFFKYLEVTDDAQVKNKAIQLVEASHHDLACLYLKYPSAGKELPYGDIFESSLKNYPPEVQNKLDDILRFWSPSETLLSYSQLQEHQISLLSSLLSLSNLDSEKFSILATCFCFFPLPEAKKLLLLKNLERYQIENFKEFLIKKPEFGWSLLEYVSQNPEDGSCFLRNFSSDSPLIDKYFRSRNPAKSLTELISETKSRPFISHEINSFIVPEFTGGAKTPNLKKLEELLKKGNDQIYLQRLCAIELQNPNSKLVESLLLCYPHTYETLSILHLEGYGKEAEALMQRINTENLISPFTEKLLATSPKHGKWLTAALKLDKKSDGLIRHLCEVKEIGALERQMTYLAAAGDHETVQILLSGLQKDLPQSRALLEWTRQENLSFVQWICREDEINSDALYQQIRITTPSNLQEGLLHLYRNLSVNSDMQRNWFDWLLGQENREEKLTKLLYLQARNLLGKNHQNVNQQYDLEVAAHFNKFNSTIAAIRDEPLSPVEKALKAQFQFSVLASDLLLNSDGSVNKGLIKELKNTDFFLENKANGTTVHHYLDWVLNQFESSGEFSERLMRASVVPILNSPAHNLVAATLGKASGTSLSIRDVQVAILSGIMQRTWQSPKVGSCFGTSVVSQSQSTPTFLLQSLDDYLELVSHGSLTRLVENCATAYPLSDWIDMSFEHPLAKGREYCISSMAATSDRSSIREMTVNSFQLISQLLGPIARMDSESFEAIQKLQQSFKEEFLKQSLEFYDPLLMWKKDDLNQIGIEVMGMRGGWILLNKNSYTKIDDEEKFNTFLLNLIENLEKKNESYPFKKGIALLRKKIQNKELSSSKMKRKNATPWCCASGGNTESAAAVYFGKTSKSLEAFSNDHKSDLKFLHKYASLLTPGAGGSIHVSCGLHAYSLFPEAILSLRKFPEFDKLHADLVQKATQFAQITITSSIAAKWIDAICSRFSRETRQKLRDYLQKHPIQESSLRDYGWRLTDALLRVSPKTSKDLNAAIVEAAILNLEELKSERPEYLLVGDYNWFSEKQDACYACYMVSPFTGVLEPYAVGENGRNLNPQYRLPSGIMVFPRSAEKPWKPLFKV